MKNRLLAIFLCLILCTSMFPAGASAECEHSLVKVNAKSTCAEAYREHYQCTKCGELFLDPEGEQRTTAAEIVLQKPVHESELQYVAADETVSCIKTGNREYWFCPDCGQKYATNDRSRPVTDSRVLLGYGPHNIDPESFHPAVDPTCDQSGRLAYYTCSVCEKAFADAEGETLLENVTLPPRHTLTEHPAVERTCTESGSRKYYSCSVCGAYLDEYYQPIEENDWIVAAGHDYVKHPETDPTCREAGNALYYSCSRCGVIVDADGEVTSLEEVTASKLPHSITIHAEAEPKTCEDSGNVEYWECEVCGARFADSEGSIPLDDVIIPASHNLEATEAHAATCTDDGNIAYWTCQDCEKIFNADGQQIWLNDTIEKAHGHTTERVPAQAATCTEAGHMEYYRCTECENLFSDQTGTYPTTLEAVAITALGHEYSWDGICMRCGAVSPDSPAFNPPPVMVPNMDSTYTVVSVSAPEGVFPANCQLSVQPVYAIDDQTQEAMNIASQGGVTVAKSFTYDIRVLKNGEEIQPADGSKVKVSFALATAENTNLDVTIYHITDDGAEALETNVEGGTVFADTDGFSLYTVVFSYRTLLYVLPSSGSVALSTILDELILTGAVVDAQSSNQELFSLSKDESGEWIVVIHKSFQTPERLTVILENADGQQNFNIGVRVTDAPTTVKVKINGGTASTAVNPAASEITVTMTPGTPIPVTITATPVPSGKTFEKWRVDAGIEAAAIDDPNAATAHFSLSDSQMSGIVQITAKYSNKVVFIKNTSAAVTNMPADRFATDGTIVESSDLTIPVAEGYVFGGWYEDAQGKTPVTFPLKINSNKTLYAHWKCEVTFSTKHGIAPVEQTIEIGGTPTKPADPSMRGYQFVEWCTDKALEKKYDFKTAISKNTTLYAKWKSDLKINDGNEGTAHYGSEYDFTLNCDFDQVYIPFELKIDGKTIDPDRYELSGTKNGTEVTLKKALVRSLAAGKHSIVFDTGIDDLGSVKGSFTVSTAPKTGDESDIGLWIAVGCLSAVAAAAIVVYLIRKKK